MAETELDTFLGPKDEPVPEAPPEQPAPEAPQPEAEPPESTPKPEAETQEPESGTVPMRVLHDTRRERQDWKEKAVRAETERDELRRQLEEAKRAPVAPPVPQQQYQPPAQIDPVSDPAGYHAHVQQLMLNERLNISEMQLRRDLGPEKVDEAVAEFKQAAAKNPNLMPQLYQQPDPYAWMAKQVEVLRMQREIGEDPAGYRAKLEAEVRAKIEAEMQATQPAERPVSPAARLAPSLANARSAAPRASGAWVGPMPLEQMFPR